MPGFPGGTVPKRSTQVTSFKEKTNHFNFRGQSWLVQAMARHNTRDEGTYFPLTRETPFDAAPPPEPEAEARSSASETTTSFTPRGQRFSKLSEAYLRITSRQALNETARKVSNQSQSSGASAATLPTTPPPSGASLWSIQSQDDIQVPISASAMPNPMKKSRRASFDSIKLPRDLPPKMGGGNGNHLSLGKQIDKELLDLEGQSHDTTDSTIDGILDQYDAPKSALEAKTDNIREVRPSTQPTLYNSITYCFVVSSCECEFFYLPAPAWPTSRTAVEETISYY